jgi:phage shock protein A
MSSKSFWSRPEGVTGGLFLAGLVLGGAWLLNRFLPVLIGLAANTLYLAGMLAALALIIYAVLDPKTRNLFWYGYQSIMRWITGIFVQIDPISILKSYIQDLEQNLRNLSKQIGALRGQMRQLKGTMDTNSADIQRNLTLAEQAKKQQDEKNITLAARKAGRLQEANEKYDILYKKMDVLYRLLSKMYENSEIVLEDTKDQITIKQQEYEAIKASHSAIRSAKSILTGDPDKQQLFDQAVEALTNDVSAKVGEMERFMDTSRNLMASIDLQNGVFEEEGLRLLEQMSKESPLLNLNKKDTTPAPTAEKPLDISQPPREMLKEKNDYSNFFD